MLATKFSLSFYPAKCDPELDGILQFKFVFHLQLKIVRGVHRLLACSRTNHGRQDHHRLNKKIAKSEMYAGKYNSDERSDVRGDECTLLLLTG